MKLHIVAPDIRAGDAVGNHCLYLAKALRHQGLETALYARRHDPDQMVHPPEKLLTSVPLSNTDDVLLISYSTFQPRLAELMALPCRKLVYFHGVTPTELLLDHDPEAAYWSSRALLQLPLLAKCEHVIANSQWNLTDLIRRFLVPPQAHMVSVIPPVTPNMPLFRRTSRPRSNLQSPLQLLTVGRLAPHKKVEDIINIVAGLQKRGVATRLTIVGGPTCEEYRQFLLRTAQSSGSSSSIDFRGHISDAELEVCYARADLLVSASLHEGFCVPVLEAMHLGIPTVLRSGTAAEEIASHTGWTYKDIESGIHQLEQLAHQPGILRRASVAAHSRAVEVLRQSNTDRWLPLIRNRALLQRQSIF